MNKTLRNCGGVLVLLALLTTGCSFASDDDVTGGNLRGVNHTRQEVSRFSVNGYGGLVGGNTCCILLPDKWRPGMKVQVKWKSVDTKNIDFPGYGDEKKFQEWQQKIAAHSVNKSAVADVPQYGAKRCGLTVHFLPCDKVKVTTSCWGYGSPEYPIKEPLNMPEPKTCPR